MDCLIDSVVSHFEKAFPDYSSYSPLIFNAVRQRAEKFEAILAFYREYEGTNPALNDICERAFRAAILDEVGKNSEQSKTVIKMFVTLNRAKVAAFVNDLVESDDVKGLTKRYPFLETLLTDYLGVLAPAPP